MKYITLLLVISFLSCNRNKKVFSKVRIDSTGKIDNLRIYPNVPIMVVHDTVRVLEPEQERYFFISYSTTKKDIHADSCNVSGFASSIGYTFPNLNDIERAVYSVLPYKKSCYQSIIINNIFEFKTKADYENFLRGHKRPVKIKTQRQCTYNPIASCNRFSLFDTASMWNRRTIDTISIPLTYTDSFHVRHN